MAILDKLYMTLSDIGNIMSMECMSDAYKVLMVSKDAMRESEDVIHLINKRLDEIGIDLKCVDAAPIETRAHCFDITLRQIYNNKPIGREPWMVNTEK